MLEKTVGIELADGKEIAVTIKRITRREKREISKTLDLKNFNANDPQFVVDYQKWEDFKEQYVLAAIKDPIALKTMDAVQTLPDISFNTLFIATQEVNGDIAQEMTEKK